MAHATCIVPGCERPVLVKMRGWCSPHFQRWQRTGDVGTMPINPTPSDRFWAKVDKRGPDECWEWQGCRNRNGYGAIGITANKVTTMVPAHRFSYEEVVGPIPDGFYMDHLCRNPPCVNPAHLEPVTPDENAKRAPNQVTTINAAKTHCPQGHEYTGRDKRGSRICMICIRAKHKRGAP